MGLSGQHVGLQHALNGGEAVHQFLQRHGQVDGLRRDGHDRRTVCGDDGIDGADIGAGVGKDAQDLGQKSLLIVEQQLEGDDAAGHHALEGQHGVPVLVERAAADVGHAGGFVDGGGFTGGKQTLALFALLFAATTTLILANSKTTAEPEKADVLIVLGAGIRGDLPSVVLRNRLDRALDCYEQNPDLLIIVSGGMGEGESSTEASVMKKWLVAAGVPADSIIEEGKSQSTEENFIFSFDIINRLFNGSGAAAESNPRVAFVTTRFHVFRASRIAKKLGYDVNGVSAKDFSPLIVNNYLRECAAITQYFCTGRI